MKKRWFLNGDDEITKKYEMSFFNPIGENDARGTARCLKYTIIYSTVHCISIYKQSVAYIHIYIYRCRRFGRSILLIDGRYLQIAVEQTNSIFFRHGTIPLFSVQGVAYQWGLLSNGYPVEILENLLVNGVAYCCLKLAGLNLSQPGKLLPDKFGQTGTPWQLPTNPLKTSPKGICRGKRMTISVGQDRVTNSVQQTDGQTVRR